MANHPSVPFVRRQRVPEAFTSVLTKQTGPHVTMAMPARAGTTAQAVRASGRRPVFLLVYLAPLPGHRPARPVLTHYHGVQQRADPLITTNCTKTMSGSLAPWA